MYDFVDGHCDTIVRIFHEGEGLFENSGQLDLKRLSKFINPVQFFAIWLNPKYYSNSLGQTLKYIDFYYEELEKNKQFISHINCFDDLMNSRKEKSIGSLLAIEGGEAIEGELSNLSILYNLGVRAITLTWNYGNEIGDGVLEKKKERGLTEFGKDVVREMNKLGMIVDVSHLSETGFWDVYKIAEKPYIASHSNARGVYDIPRNLSDLQLKAIAEKNGVIGINIYPYFVKKIRPVNTEDVVCHIDYMLKIIGEDYIGFGCDFDGIEETPLELVEVSKIKGFLEFLEIRYGERIVSKIVGQNFIRVIREIL